MKSTPKILWSLWLQGWENAPEIVKACARTAAALNPNWDIRMLDLQSAGQLLKDDPLFLDTRNKNLQPETFSDIIRICLLRKHGGVWADATVYFLKPLDSWLHENMRSGFCAFAWPPDRRLSSWFLAAAPDHYMISHWHEACRQYWSGRKSRDQYFWFHALFFQAVAANPEFKQLWSETPDLSSEPPHRFVPYDQKLIVPASEDDRRCISNAETPLLKLTHKIEMGKIPENSVYCYLCDRI
jgi:hypothetical protein